MTTGKPAARPNGLSLKRPPPEVGLPTDGRAAALAVVNNLGRAWPPHQNSTAAISRGQAGRGTTFRPRSRCRGWRSRATIVNPSRKSKRGNGLVCATPCLCQSFWTQIPASLHHLTPRPGSQGNDTWQHEICGHRRPETGIVCNLRGARPYLAYLNQGRIHAQQ